MHVIELQNHGGSCELAFPNTIFKIIKKVKEIARREGGDFLSEEEKDDKLIVSDEIVIGSKFLTRYERSRIVGSRALQVAMGAPVLIDVGANLQDPIAIATIEMEARVLPISVMRRLPDGRYQNIPVRRLMDAQYVEQIRVDFSLKDLE